MYGITSFTDECILAERRREQTGRWAGEPSDQPAKVRPPMSAATNAYAVDGLCHNAQYDTLGHECGKPATWLGRTASGFVSGYCDRCKTRGDEARNVVEWERRA